MITHLSTLESALDSLSCQYAFYTKTGGQEGLLRSNCSKFRSASIIKVPILLAWLHLERSGELQRMELCNLDDEPPVGGSGFSWLLAGRQIPFQDVLLMMIATSDNLCTNLVIRRIGIERLDAVIHGPLGLSQNTRLERKLMDYAARDRGLDNWIDAQDCIHMFKLIRELPAAEQAWVKPMFLVNQDTSMLLRDVGRDSLAFYHKTGNIHGVLHDWGFTEDTDLFLLTQEVKDEDAANRAFGLVGRCVLKWCE